MVKRESLSSESTLFTADRGSIVVTKLGAPGRLLLTLYGFNDGELGQAYYKELESCIERHGSLTLFIDCREQSGVATDERERMTQWTKAQGTKYRAGHVLFRSKLLEMAVSLVRMLTGSQIKGYSNTNVFEQVVAAEVPGFTTLPDFRDRLPKRANG